MSDNIEWGPAIAVDGKRPAGVQDADRVDVQSVNGRTWFSESALGLSSYPYASMVGWGGVKNIRLRADHPYYRQPAPIDWSGELEAVHEDGRVVAVRLSGVDQPDHDGDYGLSEFLDTRWSAGKYFKADGSQSYAYADGGRPWRIRNVTPQPTPQADAKPDVTAEAAKAIDELFNDAWNEHGPQGYGRDTAGMKAIGDVLSELQVKVRAVLLPEPMDPDLIEARKLAHEFAGDRAGWQGILEGKHDSSPAITQLITAIKRGRELALAGETGK